MVEAGRFGAITWLRGRSLSYGDGVSFWAFREIVAVAAGIFETDSDEAAERKLATTVDSLLDDQEADWVRGHLAPVLGLRGSRDGDDRRPERFAAWRRFLEARAGVEPIVLVFEDLHWADDGLLDFVASLGEWLSDVPVLVVGTARPELVERRPAWAAAEQVSVLGLEPLSDAETSALIDDLLSGSIVTAADRAALLEHASGNPLYAEQYARMVAERGEAHAVPETVQALIVARLDALPDAEKRVAQDASVTGGVFWSGSVAAAGGDDRWTIDEHLRSLERKVFVRRSREVSVAGEGEWIFAHALVRDAAYAAIPRALRAEKHLRVAGWIESLGRPDDYAELLAHHYLAALDLGSAAGVELAEFSDRALAALRRAGDRALGLHAYAAAAHFHRRALDLTAEDDPERGRTLLELGLSLFLSEAGGEDELLAARDALRDADDRERAAEAEILLAERYRGVGRPELYEKHLAAAEELARGLGPSEIKARVLLTVGGAFVRTGDYEEAITVGREALALVEDLGVDELRARALSQIGWARLELDDEAGFADLEQSLELAMSLGSPEAIRAHSSLAHQLRHRGDFRRGLEHLEEAIRLADRFGDAPFGRFLRGILPHNRYREGRWEEALDAADAYLAEVQNSHFHVWQALGTRGLIRLSRGDERGLDDSATSIAAARRSVDSTVLPAALEVRARSLVLAGRHDEATEAMEEALRILETGIVRPGYDLPHLVVTALELGRDEERVLAIARPSRWKDAAQSYLAGDFVRAADVYAEIGSPTDEAEARLRAGRSLLASGRRAEAEEQLQKALAFYASVGAARYVREAEALLADRFPRRACSRSIASKSALKFPIPKPREPWRSMTSKNSVGRSWTIFVKSWSR